MSDRSDYLSFGSIKKDASHGILLRRAIERFQDHPGAIGRKRELLRRLEISEVAEELGLADAMIGLFLTNKSAMENEPESGREAVKESLLQLLQRELRVTEASNTGPAQAGPVPASAAPTAPVPDQPSPREDEGSTPAPNPSVAEERIVRKPTGSPPKKKSPLAGLVKLEQ